MNDSINSASNNQMPLNDSFTRMLIYDVIQAMERRDKNDTQTARRDLIRTTFAAIEGLSWVYREDIRSVANTIDPLSPTMELAFAETTYFVDEKGHLQEQPRYISVPAMIRLVSRVAEQICPELKIDFGVSGWTDLQLVMKIRNRITHPKNASNLEVSKGDIEISKSALYWFFKLTNNVMEATLFASSQYLEQATIVLDKLRAGDPDTLAQYRSVLMNEKY